MKIVSLTLGALFIAPLFAQTTPAAIVLRAGTVLDGKGGTSRNRTIVVFG